MRSNALLKIITSFVFNKVLDKNVTSNKFYLKLVLDKTFSLINNLSYCIDKLNEALIMHKFLSVANVVSRSTIRGIAMCK